MRNNWNDIITPLYIDGYRRLYTVAYRRVNDQELAQDLVHDAFLLAIFHQKELREHPQPDAWLMKTLCNLIQNELRSPSHQNLSFDEIKEIPEKAACDTIGYLLPVQLKDDEREILIWRFEQQMSYSEMSMRLGVSETLCRKRVSLAIIKCRNLMER